MTSAGIKAKILAKASCFEYINKYLGKYVRTRVATAGYTRGALTAELSNGDDSLNDLNRLDWALCKAERLCADFGLIFKERNLSKIDKVIDNELIDQLAEVRACECLIDNGFTLIKKIRCSDRKTVDFTAERNGVKYAVEVTRLGIKTSTKKKTKYLTNEKASGLRLKILSGGDNRLGFHETLKSAVRGKILQIKSACESGSDKGIIFISSGRDYFLSGRHVDTSFHCLPATAKKELENVFQQLKLGYLSHIALALNKSTTGVIFEPVLERKNIV